MTSKFSGKGVALVGAAGLLIFAAGSAIAQEWTPERLADGQPFSMSGLDTEGWFVCDL